LIRHVRQVFGYIDLTRIIYPHPCKRGSGVIVNIVGTAARNPNDA
jgi:NADP-dependent 3-hydroxy acid dehydrogenase YdfG